MCQELLTFSCDARSTPVSHAAELKAHTEFTETAAPAKDPEPALAMAESLPSESVAAVEMPPEQHVATELWLLLRSQLLQVLPLRFWLAVVLKLMLLALIELWRLRAKNYLKQLRL